MHTSERRYRVIDLGHRLQRNDGGLVRLRLSSESIDDELLHILCDNLSGNTVVQHIMLNNNKVTDNGIKRLVKALKRHPAIHTLWLGGNLISDRGVLYLCELCRHNGRVKEINLSNRWPELRWEGAEHSEHPRVTADGAALLAELLATPHSHGGTIHNLSLSQQRIGDRGAALLFRAIPFSHLRTLCLSDNQLTDKCCSALGELLSASHANLEYLNLSRNQISDAGVRLFAPPLETNHILAACDLSYNEISQVGFDLLLDALYANPTMRAMALHNNLTNDTAIEVFLKNRLLHTVSSQLEPSPERAREGSGFLKQFLESGDGFVDVTSGQPDPSAEDQSIAEDTQSLVSFDSAPLGSKPLGQRVVAARLIADSNSNLGAYGKAIPSRAPREGSPLAANPFHASSSTSGVSEKQSSKRDPLPQMSLSRTRSPDLHLHSQESLLECSLADSKESSDGKELSVGSDGASHTRPSQRLALYRSQSSVSSDHHPVPNTTALAMGLLAKQDSFEFEPCEGDEDAAADAFLILKKDEGATARKFRPSHELGKITGVPYLGSLAGAQAIRSATQRHRDSCNHLMYLQVLTPADPPGTLPYPVVMVLASPPSPLR
jgi:Ran GTPase-activating protein (RanGAP) involved in mRNA processing and transport